MADRPQPAAADLHGPAAAGRTAPASVPAEPAHSQPAHSQPIHEPVHEPDHEPVHREHASAEPTDWRATGERIDALIAAGAAGGAVARERGEELVRLVSDFHGAGLARLMDILHEQGGLDDATLAALAADELVSSVLLVHGLHPYEVATRIEKALESVRPYLVSHGGDVELVGVTDEGGVRLRLLGSCDSCASSAATLELAVRGAVEAAAPEITAIEVVGADPEASAAGALVPVDTLFSRVRESGVPAPGGPGASWHPVPELAGLESGAVTHFTAAGVAVVACRVGPDVFAFHDRCGRCDRPMAGAVLARRLGGGAGDAVLRCPACHVHFDVRRAGASADAADVHLDPLPVLADGATVSVAVPAPVAP